MSERLWRLKGRRAFRELSRAKERVVCGPLVLKWKLWERSANAARVALGVGVSRKAGRAVVRNSLKRRVRVIVSEFASELPPGAYWVRVVRPLQKYEEKELRGLIDRAFRAVRQSRDE